MARTQGSHSDITRPKVAEAALRLFARHGYAAVSMRAIAAEVGVQVGTLYHYTPDKQALLYDLLSGHMAALMAAHDGLDQTGDAAARLERFVRFHIGYHLDRPEAVFIAYMELRNLTLANFTRIEALRRSYEDRLEAVLTAGAASGAFHVPDSRIATMAVIAMLTGVTTWYRPGGRLTGADVADLYWDMVCRAVTA